MIQSRFTFCVDFLHFCPMIFFLLFLHIVLRFVRSFVDRFRYSWTVFFGEWTVFFIFSGCRLQTTFLAPPGTMAEKEHTTDSSLSGVVDVCSLSKCFRDLLPTGTHIATTSSSFWLSLTPSWPPPSQCEGRDGDSPACAYGEVQISLQESFVLALNLLAVAGGASSETLYTSVCDSHQIKLHACTVKVFKGSANCLPCVYSLCGLNVISLHISIP